MGAMVRLGRRWGCEECGMKVKQLAADSNSKQFNSRNGCMQFLTPEGMIHKNLQKK
jgi:hypothetical protein